MQRGKIYEFPVINSSPLSYMLFFIIHPSVYTYTDLDPLSNLLPVPLHDPIVFAIKERVIRFFPNCCEFKVLHANFVFL